MQNDAEGDELSFRERLELARDLRGGDHDERAPGPARLAGVGAVWLVTWILATVATAALAALDLIGVQWWMTAVAGGVLVASVATLAVAAVVVGRGPRGT